MNAQILREHTVREDNFTSCQVLIKCRPAYRDCDFIVAEVWFDHLVVNDWCVDLHRSNWHGTILDDSTLDGSEVGTVDFRGVLNRLGYSVEDGRVH